MSVRLKFECYEKTQHAHSYGHTVKLRPVVPAAGETAGDNANFYKWTPSGELVFSTINDAAADKLELGKSYYIDLNPA